MADWGFDYDPVNGTVTVNSQYSKWLDAISGPVDFDGYLEPDLSNYILDNYSFLASDAVDLGFDITEYTYDEKVDYQTTIEVDLEGLETAFNMALGDVIIQMEPSQVLDVL